jgi:hypothetical protein
VTGSSRQPRAPSISPRARPMLAPAASDVAVPAGCHPIQPESVELTSGSGQIAAQYAGAIHPSANVPTSALSASRCNQSGVAVSSATLPLLAQSSVCCIHRLNPPSENGPCRPCASSGGNGVGCGSSESLRPALIRFFTYEVLLSAKEPTRHANCYVEPDPGETRERYGKTIVSNGAWAAVAIARFDRDYLSAVDCAQSRIPPAITRFESLKLAPQHPPCPSVTFFFANTKNGQRPQASRSWMGTWRSKRRPPCDRLVDAYGPRQRVPRRRNRRA